MACCSLSLSMVPPLPIFRPAVLPYLVIHRPAPAASPITTAFYLLSCLVTGPPHVSASASASAPALITSIDTWLFRLVCCCSLSLLWLRVCLRLPCARGVAVVVSPSVGSDRRCSLPLAPFAQARRYVDGNARPRLASPPSTAVALQALTLFHLATSCCFIVIFLFVFLAFDLGSSFFAVFITLLSLLNRALRFHVDGRRAVNPRGRAHFDAVLHIADMQCVQQHQLAIIIACIYVFSSNVNRMP